MAMTRRKNCALWGFLLILGGAGSCSSDDAPRGGRLAHPVETGVKATSGPEPAPSPQTSAAATEASAVATSASSVTRPPSPSEEFEKRWGLKLTPADKAIMDDCPARAWSKDVPKRRCTKDSECGDGFCDRDHCAPLWSCGKGYSRPCQADDQCAGGPCIDGRCRSCSSDTECERLRRVGGAKCFPDSEISGARECYGAPSVLPPAPAATIP